MTTTKLCFGSLLFFIATTTKLCFGSRSDNLIDLGTEVVGVGLRSVGAGQLGRDDGGQQLTLEAA